MKKDDRQDDLFEWVEVERVRILTSSPAFLRKIKEQELYFERHQTLLPPDHPESLVQIMKRRR